MIDDRQKRFRELLREKPEKDDILTTKNNKPIVVERNHRETLVKFVANLQVDQEATGWYICGESRGLKALILPKADSKKYQAGELNGILLVTKLKVVRQSEDGKAIICEYLY